MKEKQFWNRILEFAQERLTRSMYDFYAIQAELIKVEENVATIFLPRSEMEMVWEKQLKDIIVVAGFEIYDAEITPHYISPNLKIRLSHKLKKLQIQLFMTIVQG